jgi:7-cyano-7-deazaguanine synthase
MDSTISLRLFQVFGYKVAALHFKYGQQAETAEEYCSKKICEILGVPWYCLRYPTEGFESPLLEKTKPPLDALWDSESTFSYVHQRNLIMSSMAFALAEQLGYGGISLGFNESDSSGYPDNGVPFVRKLNELTPYSSNWQVRLHVYAPFVNLMKSELLEVGLKIGVPFEYVCSCYYPKLSKEGFPIYCGDCGCDTLYRYAWTKLGYRPPNLGFEKLDLPLPQLIKVNPSLRLNLEEIPYGYVIEETL